MIHPILRIGYIQRGEGSSYTRKYIDLLNSRGWLLKEWSPAVPEAKGGGIFRDSPFVDGRRLAYKRLENITDTFNLVISGESQNITIASIRELEKILEKATTYWTSYWQYQPIWIEARSPSETNIRYATIVDYKMSGFGGPYQQPFFGECNSASEVILVLEHTIWQETEPGFDECVHLDNQTTYFSVEDMDSDTFTPGGSSFDATYVPTTVLTTPVDTTGSTLSIGYTTSRPGNATAGIVFGTVDIPTDAKIVRATLTTTISAPSIASYTGFYTVEGQSMIGGMLDELTLVSGGSGYVEPYVEISGGGGGITNQGQIIADVLNGVIINLRIVDRGRGYINPTLRILDRGHGAYVPAVATVTATAVGAEADDFDGTIKNFELRTKTEASVTFRSTGSYWPPVDVTSIVQEIVNSTYWVQGSDVGFFMSLAPGSSTREGREIYSFDNGSDYPELYVEWSTRYIPLGMEKTCAPEVFVSNKRQHSPVYYIYTYDSGGGGSFSSNLYGYDYTIGPLNLLPDPPKVGDMIYFGNDSSFADYTPFTNLVFDLYSFMQDVTGVWEYSKSVHAGGWEEFVYVNSINDNICGDAYSFNTLRVCSIVWQAMSGWDAATVNGKNGLWVRFKVTAIGGTPVTPAQFHRDIYTSILPYIDIDAEEIPGDYPALARIQFSAASCEVRAPNTLVMGLRSLSRGENFSAYLNASDWPTNYNIPFFQANTDESVSIVSDIEAPTGKATLLDGFDPGDTWTNVCSWIINPWMAWEYVGVYHAYIRCRFTAAAIGCVKLRLHSEFGEKFNTTYSEVAGISLDEFGVIDVGQFTILPFGSRHMDDYLAQITINLEACEICDNANVFNNGYIYDIVLIPADEWAGNFGMPRPVGDLETFDYGKQIDIDGTTVPKQYRAVERSTPIPAVPGQITAEWYKIASGEPIFQANSNQRLWFLQFLKQTAMEAYFENCGIINTRRSARYLLMRGDG